jgi:hypothetical protein
MANPVKVKSGAVVVEPVANVLERDMHGVIEGWYIRVNKKPDLASIPLTHDERTGHLPHLMHDVINRLRIDAKLEAPLSKTAAEHDDLRCKQGYTTAMMVE